MTAEKDLRDHTKALNNLAQKMGMFNQVAAELSRNLQALSKTPDGKKVFQVYVDGVPED